MNKLVLHIVAIILFLSTGKLLSQSYEIKIDNLINTEFGNMNEPGGVFMVSKKGKEIYKKAFGKSNIELDTNTTTENVFQIGSMTKQFTAVAILMLEEQGKLKISNPISNYIPEYPNGNTIKIEHLLTHTSGIKDFTKMKSIKEIAQKEMTPKMMVDFFMNEPVDFLPGEKFEYNNSGYVILGHLIELVSGETYENFVEKNIFEKSGMINSRYANDREIIKKRALGYHKKESGYVNKTIINYSVPFSSGALMSTVDDLLKWQIAINQNLLLNKESTKKLYTKYKLNNGETTTYGYGWHLKEINGHQTREHGGSIFGYKSMAIYFPDEEIYIVGLSNCDCHSPTQIVKDIASLTIESF